MPRGDGGQPAPRRNSTHLEPPHHNSTHLDAPRRNSTHLDAPHRNSTHPSAILDGAMERGEMAGAKKGE